MKIKRKNKMKPCKKPLIESKTRVKQTFFDPEFKKTVVSFAEKTGNTEARRKFGVSTANNKRWRAKTRLSIKQQTEKSLPQFPNKPKNKNLDSMPLEQRLKSPLPVPPEPTEPVLQSQPLSPTKLKVTRQAKPSQPSPKPPTPPPPPPPPIEEVCLKWNSHHSNMQNTFPSLLLREQYVDATLVAEGQTLKCHRVILSSCSPYFEEVLASISPYQHPVLFMKDMPFWILKSLCDFMYSGQVHILQTKLEELLAVAENLKIKGLAGQVEVTNQEIKPEFPNIIKEEIKEEVKKKEEKEVKKKDEKEVKKKEEKEVKKKEEKEVKKKEEKEVKRKEEKEVKRKEEKEAKKKEDKEIKKREEKEIKKKEDKEIKKKEEKEIKKKEEKEAKPPEAKQLKRKEEKETKKRDEKEVREKKKAVQLAPVAEMPVLKSSKSVKIALQHSEMPILKSTKTLRGAGISKRMEKKAVEKEKIEKPLSSKDTSHKKDFFDPLLDLLEPVYEELAKDPKPTKAVVPRDPKNFALRRNLQKKVKKRKITDEREESPPPVFTRKGTRSRPNRKVPKYFHPPDDQSTIVREPHTDQADPLMHLQCIKSEPIYEDSIEIEDNLVGFSESSMSVEEQLIGSYEQSSFGDYSRRTTRSRKEIQPIIMDVQSIANKKEESPLNIISVAQLRDTKLIDPLEDPLTLNQSISDSPANVEGTDNTLGFRISQVMTEKEDSRSSEACADMGFQITNVVSTQEVVKKSEIMMEEDASIFTEFEGSVTIPKTEVCNDDTMNEENVTSLEEPEPMDTHEEDQSDILPTTSFDNDIINKSSEVQPKDSGELIDNSQSSDKEFTYTDNEFEDTGTQDNFEGTLAVKSDLINKNEEDPMLILPATTLQANTTQDSHELIDNCQSAAKESFAAENEFEETGCQDNFVEDTLNRNTDLETISEAELLPKDTDIEEPEVDSDIFPTDSLKLDLQSKTSSLQEQHITSPGADIAPTDSFQEEPQNTATELQDQNDITSSLARSEEDASTEAPTGSFEETPAESFEEESPAESFEEAPTGSFEEKEEDSYSVNEEQNLDAGNVEKTNSNTNLEIKDMAESHVGETYQSSEVVEDELPESVKDNEEKNTNELDDCINVPLPDDEVLEEETNNTNELNHCTNIPLHNKEVVEEENMEKSENDPQDTVTLGNQIKDDENMEFSENLQETEDRLEKELLQDNNDISSNFDGSNDKNYENNLLNDDYIPGNLIASNIPKEADTTKDNINVLPENDMEYGISSDEHNEDCDAENSSNTVPESYIKNQSSSDTVNENCIENNTNVFPGANVEAVSSTIALQEDHFSDESSSNVINEEYVAEESDSNMDNENIVPEKKTSNIFNENCDTNDINAIIPPTEKESSINGPSDNFPAIATRTYLPNSNTPEPKCQTEQASSSSSQPGFHIAQVVSEQIAEIEGSRFSDHFSNRSKSLSDSCEKNYNELESIVNDLSKIVGETCSSLESESMDDTNSIADSLENLLQK